MFETETNNEGTTRNLNRSGKEAARNSELNPEGIPRNSELNRERTARNSETNHEGTTEQQDAASQTEPTGEETGKTFTQEEVDRIIEKRLNRERKKFSSLLNGDDLREIELAEREKALEIKELRADAKGTLAEKGLPMAALELLNYTDKESCEKSIEALETVVKAASQARIESLLRGGKPIKKGPPTLEEPADPLRGVFSNAFRTK